MKINALIFLSGVFQFSNGNPTGDIRIVGGEEAVLGQFPHQVLWAVGFHNEMVMCGGIIYSKSTIITAAHCCKPFEEGGGLRSVVATLLFYQIEPYKKGPFLVLPSSIARNSSAPNAKRIFQIHRGILEGCTNRARPSRPSLKNCQNGTF